jgi:GNAT superfamily N-acetyltransferase
VVPQASEGLLLVAEEKGCLVGCAIGETCANSADVSAVLSPGTVYLEVSALYVQPAHRYRGIGGALLEQVLATARMAGIERFSLYKGSREIDGVTRIHRRQGFRPGGVQTVL